MGRGGWTARSRARHLGWTPLLVAQQSPHTLHRVFLCCASHWEETWPASAEVGVNVGDRERGPSLVPGAVRARAGSDVAVPSGTVPAVVSLAGAAWCGRRRRLLRLRAFCASLSESESGGKSGWGTASSSSSSSSVAGALGLVSVTAATAEVEAAAGVRVGVGAAAIAFAPVVTAVGAVGAAGGAAVAAAGVAVVGVTAAAATPPVAWNAAPVARLLPLGKNGMVFLPLLPPFPLSLSLPLPFCWGSVELVKNGECRGD